MKQSPRFPNAPVIFLAVAVVILGACGTDPMVDSGCEGCDGELFLSARGAQAGVPDAMNLGELIVLEVQQAGRDTICTLTANEVTIAPVSNLRWEHTPATLETTYAATCESGQRLQRIVRVLKPTLMVTPPVGNIRPGTELDIEIATTQVHGCVIRSGSIQEECAERNCSITVNAPTLEIACTGIDEETATWATTFDFPYVGLDIPSLIALPSGGPGSEITGNRTWSFPLLSGNLGAASVSSCELRANGNTSIPIDQQVDQISITCTEGACALLPGDNLVTLECVLSNAEVLTADVNIRAVKLDRFEVFYMTDTTREVAAVFVPEDAPCLPSVDGTVVFDETFEIESIALVELKCESEEPILLAKADALPSPTLQLELKAIEGGLGLVGVAEGSEGCQIERAGVVEPFVLANSEYLFDIAPSLFGLATSVQCDNGNLKSDGTTVSVKQGPWMICGGDFTNSSFSGGIGLVADCEAITGNLSYAEGGGPHVSVTTDQLVAVGGYLQLGNATGDIEFPNLTSVKGIIAEAPLLTTASFPALRHVHFTLQFLVSPQLVKVSFPVLDELGQSLLLLLLDGVMYELNEMFPEDGFSINNGSAPYRNISITRVNGVSCAEALAFKDLIVAQSPSGVDFDTTIINSNSVICE